MTLNFSVRLPNKEKGELFAVAEQLVGGSRMKAICEDGKSRMVRIPGKLKRRHWIRNGDLLIIKPWEFQNDKADVILRYTKTQANNLARKAIVPDVINIFK